MTPAVLHRLGEALYGERWVAPLARVLNVSPRTVRRWAAGTLLMPQGLEVELRALADERIAALLSLT